MTTDELTEHRPTLADARVAARDFLQEALPDVYRVDVTRVMPIESPDSAWEIEAIAWQPNATIQALHLSTRHPVLDHCAYVIRLDSQLNVIAYETGGG